MLYASIRISVSSFHIFSLSRALPLYIYPLIFLSLYGNSKCCVLYPILPTISQAETYASVRQLFSTLPVLLLFRINQGAQFFYVFKLCFQVLVLLPQPFVLCRQIVFGSLVISFVFAALTSPFRHKYYFSFKQKFTLPSSYLCSVVQTFLFRPNAPILPYNLISG